MKSLVLSDLHYDMDDSVSKELVKQVTEIKGDFNAVLLCGDNAKLAKGLENHRFLFEKLKERFECPIGFVLGNHELWGKTIGISSLELLDVSFPRLAKEYELTYLEQCNLDLGRYSFVGTYGHYDYSFLRKGKGVSIEDLLRGTFIVGKREITWKDRGNMDWEGKDDKEVCARLIKRFEERIKKAKGNVISLSHTLPRLTLNGWPNSKEQYFMEAYSGSNLLGDVLEKYGGKYHFCGHTHKQASAKVGKTTIINPGSDYDLLRYAILEG